MKRVLIIVYYWPPSGGAGVQRWLKFAKYLPNYNWQPVIYTPENPDFKLQDENLLSEIPSEAEVIKRPIWEPYSTYRKLFGKSEEKDLSTGVMKKEGLKSKIANWLRGNLFIPDPKVFWRKPSVKYLKEYLKEHPVDLIISSGTPHSMHLIAMDLKRELGLKWIADFRDPWTELDMLEEYHISSSSFKKYRNYEKEVLDTADLCITTSKVWAKDFERLGAARCECITNGYDESDFENSVEPYKDFVISHFGLLNHMRNPSTLWEALEEMLNEDPDFKNSFKLHLGGTIDGEIIKEIEGYPNLSSSLKVFPYISHEEVITEYQRSSLLLLLLFNSKSGRGNIPGKLFEYLASEKAILAFGPDRGDSAEIVEENGGKYFLYSSKDKESIKAALNSLIAQGHPSKSSSKQYSREKLTAKLAAYLDQLSA
ncbi:MAG: glycosyl transferase family 1 [Flavobacteriales bacterium]|nr:glycosyl transferase family 1 [Flavobacteriales bacterium]